MERRDLQPVLSCAISQALADVHVTLDANHRRRLLRCLLRTAARLLVDADGELSLYVAVGVQAFVDELATGYPSRLPCDEAGLRELGELN